MSLSYLDKPSESILSISQYSNFICQHLLIIPSIGNISIIDTKTKVFTETTVKVAAVGSVFKVITMKCEEKDKQLCYGYVNTFYRKRQYQIMQSLPQYLIKLIRNFVSIETLHLFSNQGHYV